MTSLLHYLRDTLHVTPVGDDHLKVSITLPSDHFLHYLRILESLTGFVHLLDKHARRQRLKDDQRLKQQQEEAAKALSRYNERVSSLFDQYTAEGLSRNQAIKQIGADLRAEKHPWSSPDLVRVGLREAGRLGRPARARRPS